MSENKHVDLARLAEMIEHGSRIANWLRDKAALEFLEDAMLRDAVSMNLLVIGEAANGLSDLLTAQSGESFWDDLRGLRNRLAHGHGAVDWLRIWTIATRDLPHLIAAAQRLVSQISEPSQT